MKPDDIITELSIQLSHQGVVADHAALEAFAARLQRESAADPDIKEAARRFSEGCGNAWRKLTKRRFKALVNGVAFCATGAMFAAGAALCCWLCVAATRPSADPDIEAVAVAMLIAATAIALCLGTLGTFCFRKARRLSNEIERIVQPDSVAAASLPCEPTTEPGDESLAEEFRARREAAVAAMRRMRVRAWVGAVVLSVVGAALAVPGLWFWFYSRGSGLGPGVPWLAGALVGGLLNMVGLVGLLTLALGAADMAKAWHLSRQIKRAVKADTTP